MIYITVHLPAVNRGAHRGTPRLTAANTTVGHGEPQRTDLVYKPHRDPPVLQQQYFMACHETPRRSRGLALPLPCNPTPSHRPVCGVCGVGLGLGLGLGLE